MGEARQDYKIQMTFQGAWPEEAKELKQEYEQKVLKLKKQYATCHSGDAKALGLAATSDATGTNLLLLGMSVISAFLGAVVTGAAMRVHKAGMGSSSETASTLWILLSLSCLLVFSMWFLWK